MWHFYSKMLSFFKTLELFKIMKENKYLQTCYCFTYQEKRGPYPAETAVRSA